MPYLANSFLKRLPKPSFLAIDIPQGSKKNLKKPSPTGPQRTKPKSPNLKTIPELKKIMEEKAKTLTKLPLKDFLQSTRRVRI